MAPAPLRVSILVKVGQNEPIEVGVAEVPCRLERNEIILDTSSITEMGEVLAERIERLTLTGHPDPEEGQRYLPCPGEGIACEDFEPAAES